MTNRNENTDVNVDFCLKLSKLPPEVLVVILGYLPKCVLPELLYFPPIREVVAFTILSNVNITYSMERQRWKGEPWPGYIETNYHRFDIKLNNLKKGISQWNIYPKSIHMDGSDQLEQVLETFPELLTKASDINGAFTGFKDRDLKVVLKFLIDSKIKFNSLSLSGFSNLIAFHPTVTNFSLSYNTLIRYEIPGLKKLAIVLGCSGIRNRTHTFLSDLEDLTIKDYQVTQLNLPPFLRRLSIARFSDSVDIISEKLVSLEYLELEYSKNGFFIKTEIAAPNLKTLILKKCQSATNFDELRRFQKLKHLSLKCCTFPSGIFEKGLFPELEIFKYIGNYESTYPANKYHIALHLPSNLRHLSIKHASFLIINLNAFFLPPKLTHLELWNVKFSKGYLYLSKNLEFIRISAPVIRFLGNFKIPPQAKHVQMKAKFLSIRKPDFMYHLPDGLKNLQLISNGSEKVLPLGKKIHWPKSLIVFCVHNLGLNFPSLELWNFNNSNLEEIDVIGGFLEKLHADGLPTSLKMLTMKNLRIEKLGGSFENLKSLERLSLHFNDIKYITDMEFPSLKFLDSGDRKVDLVPPVSISLVDAKKKLLNLEHNGNDHQ
ncbi:hypothetical protein MG3_01071 [Candida albicans P78048]|uniref:F-box domain-containing protein n=1 Tax=Candida albicans P78048 TaxID=1094989 RepID=A0AB34PWR5_CANAX|nr:hypothetical protein MG3_01071 [Candida albicans P78048]